jgi:hypothetical protein
VTFSAQPIPYTWRPCSFEGLQLPALYEDTVACTAEEDRYVQTSVTTKVQTVAMRGWWRSLNGS